MIYPNFLKENDILGITALSGGAGTKINEVKLSLNNLKKDYKLIITPNVYGDDYVSSDSETRINQFNDLLNENINGLMNICGGDFTYETINDLDFEKLINKRLLYQGSSDTSMISYLLATKYDYASLTGFNAKGYDSELLDKDQLDNLEFMKGNLVIQKSYHDRVDYSINGDFSDRGVIIGGCLDVIRFIFGTKQDNIKSFINKYKDKKIIWYFDIFCMGSVDVYLTLLQMKNMGCFKYTDTFIFSKVLYPNVELDITYSDAYQKALGNKNIIVDSNIGHVRPRFTILNGSLATVRYENNELMIKQELLNENNG